MRRCLLFHIGIRCSPRLPLRSGFLLLGPESSRFHPFSSCSFSFPPYILHTLLPSYLPFFIYAPSLPSLANQRVTSVTFSPDSKRIASGSQDKTIRVWDAATGKIVSGPFQGHTESVTSVAFSQDNKRIVSGSRDGTILIWDVKTGHITSGPFKGHTLGVMSVAFSKDGKQVASGSLDLTVLIWDAKTGEIISGPFEGHTKGVASVAFSQDSKQLVSGSYDSTIRIWDLQTSKSFLETPPSVFSDKSDMIDGWILGTNGELLFWVPPAHRTALWRPSNTCVIGRNSAKLDMSRFVHGTSWHCYREPLAGA